MKTLGLALLWIAAFGFALWLLLRARRGKPVVLKGSFGPRFARMVVVILLALGLSPRTTTADEPKDAPAKAQPVVKPAPVPDILDARTINAARRMEELYAHFRKAYALRRLGGKAAKPLGREERFAPARMLALAEEEFAAGDGSLPAKTARELMLALTEAERGGFISHFTVGFLWRWTRALPWPAGADEQAQQVVLFDGLDRHARLANALVKAHAEVKPMALAPRAWASKAGRKREVMSREAKIQKELLDAARKHYPNADAAPWSTEAGVTLRMLTGAPAMTVRRGGAAIAVAPGQTTHMGRLDLIDTRAYLQVMALEHAWVGVIGLPSRQLIPVWELPKHLSAAAKQKVGLIVTKALLGDEASASLVEIALPLTHRAVRKALDERPDAPGANRLRTLLHLFTD